MEAHVPAYAWVVVLGSEAALVAWLTAMVRRVSGGRAALLTGAGLLAWLALVASLAGAGLFRPLPGAPPRIGGALLVPLLVGGGLLLFSARVRDFVSRLPAGWVVGAQTVRLLGIVFVLLEGRGVLPGTFARPAGWGDFAVGVTAPLVALALARRWAHAGTWAALWNALGVLDLMVAVSIGALAADSSVRLIHTNPSTAAMASLPLSTIPTFAVPLFLLLHAASFLGMGQRVARPVLVAADVAS
jgi:hypothetical protein